MSHIKRILFISSVASFLISTSYAQPNKNSSNNQVIPAVINNSSEVIKTNNTPPVKNSVCEVKMVMRELWEDNVSWVRNYTISELLMTGERRIISRKILFNQDKIGDAIKPYYGETAGNELTTLLRKHFSIAENIISAVKENNKTDLRTEQDKWSKNSDEIADFLSKLNPNLNKKEISNTLQKNLDLTAEEAKARATSDWNQDVKSYEENQKVMLDFSDQLVDAIAKQFPEKFKN